MQDWLYGAVDLLASQYGWEYEKILYSVYPEDFFLLSRQIKIRRTDETLLAIAIAAAPQSEDRDFVESLLETQRFMQGADPDPRIDREGLETLRSTVQGSGSKFKTGKKRTTTGLK